MILVCSEAWPQLPEQPQHLPEPPAPPLVQARCLPETGAVRLQVYGVDSHRLALYLDSKGQLERIVRGASLRAQGLADTGALRLANLF